MLMGGPADDQGLSAGRERLKPASGNEALVRHCRHVGSDVPVIIEVSASRYRGTTRPARGGREALRAADRRQLNLVESCA